MALFSDTIPADADRAELVLGHLRRMIAAGDLVPGERLPPERTLAAELQVNRATLRKALGRLEQEGLISRHVGRGTFVGTAPAEPLGSTSTRSPIDLMDARLTLEPAIAAEAALRHHKAHLDQMRLCLDRGRAVEDFESFEAWDNAFHRSIAEATQNPILLMVMDMVREMRNQPQWERLKLRTSSPERRDRYRRDHEAILKAIADRDPQSAAGAMFDHLQSVRATLLAASLRKEAAPAEPAGAERQLRSVGASG
ncbi:FadR/GntR family transcriptional regulator [Faunimonas sp. B44]|uniref:FadR/GntR family transcriptional regulator n=1 Tax=Faunimonas sp. B44 TaxID=3461493 RepID=UPI0040451850